MWLTTTTGFYSAVTHRTDPMKIIVRARVRKDLVQLCELSSRKISGDDWPAPEDIITTPKADYHYRLVVPRATWNTMVALLADEVDYPNFKDAVKAKQGEIRATVYTGVWAKTIAIEQEER